MKNLFIKYITVISLVSLFAIAWSNTLKLNDKELAIKLQIETNLSEKVSNVISKVYNANQFAVTTNVDLLSSNQKSNTAQTVQSFGALELEGILPAVPSTNQSTGAVVSSNDYRVQIKDITIWLDSDLNVINAQNEIKPYIFDAMDWLSECDNCIQFKSMQFPNSGSTSTSGNTSTSNNIDNEDLQIIEENIEYILNQLDQLADAGEADGISKNEWMIDYLTRALNEEKIKSNSLYSEVLATHRYQSKEDSLIKMMSVENITKMAESSNELAKEAMNTNSEVNQKASDDTRETIKSLKPDNTILYVILGLLMVLLIVLVILDRRGPKTVYLKPKKNKDTNTEQAQDTKQEISSPATSSNNMQASETLDATTAYIDESVVQSDLKSMKQSAVKMSVGQKQGASQIVQDWLDDGGDNDSGDNNDSTKEQTNE